MVMRSSSVGMPSRNVDAEWQRKSGLKQPPLSQVEVGVEPFGRIGQLAFVNEKPCVCSTRTDLVHDLVERHLTVLRLLAEVQPQHEERRRHPSRYGDLDVL